jgi:hypothetical protein
MEMQCTSCEVEIKILEFYLNELILEMVDREGNS